MTRGLTLLVALAATTLPCVAAAQTATSRAVGQDRPDQATPVRPQASGPAPQSREQAPPPVPAIAPFTLASVRVEGSSLPPGLIEAAARPFVGQTVDGAGANRIADAVAAAYARDGRIALYTVYAPDQAAEGGVLRLTAVEGRIAEVALEGPIAGKDMTLVRAYLAHLTAERPLTRRTLERYVSLIRDIPGLESNIDIVPGAQLGEVRLRVGLKPRAFRLGVSVNNRGTALLGRTQVQLDAVGYSLFRQGDQTRLTFAAPTQLERFQYYAAAHSTPLGANGTTAQINVGYLRTKPDFADLNGHAYSAGFQVSHALKRSFSKAIYLTAGIDGLNSDNALFGRTLSQDRVRAVRLAASYGAETQTRFFGARASVSLGLGDALGGRTLNPGGAELGFAKFNASATYSSRFARHFVLRLNAAGQVAGDRLPGSEQFALGGDLYGRGYESALISGDHALAGSAEVAFRPVSGLPDALGGSELYGFVDGGKVWYRARYGYPTETLKLASVGGGVRVAVKQKLELELEAARGLSNPVFLLDRKDTPLIQTVRSLF
jgi:hemolysin activation/secretion protein